MNKEEFMNGTAFQIEKNIFRYNENFGGELEILKIAKVIDGTVEKWIFFSLIEEISIDSFRVKNNLLGTSNIFFKKLNSVII